jgi:ATP-dependent DNA helicase DinG
VQTIQDLFGPAGPLGAALPGFQPRAEQVAMAEAVSAALEARSTLVVEAGTGTGKTYAYLVPALLSGRRVIVSTGTRTLQDQLFHRDLPLVCAALGRPVKVALLKGRANYLCRHRLALAVAAPELAGFERARQRSLARIERWSFQTTSGDIGELEAIPDNDPVWPSVTSTRDNCVGQDCAEFRHCHVVRARREAQAAELVIVNHHLLLADMALREEGFGELLPGAEAVILDEAHQFPEVAAQFFGSQVSGRALGALLRDAEAELVRAGLGDAANRALTGALEAQVATLAAALAGLPERTEWAALPDAVPEAAAELAALLGRLATRLDDPALEAPGVRQCGRRAAELAARLALVLADDDGAGLRWVDTSGRSWSLEFTPFEVAERLRAQVAARPCAWIYTSATLAVGSDFRHFTSRVGAEDARTALIQSPFDYARQSRLYLPEGLPEPADRRYTAAVVEAALPLIRAAGGRAFLLFTSYRALGEAHGLLRAALGPGDEFPLLAQGEGPRDALLRRFRELGNAVLLGTSSFWEGVDVRGPALSLVVIDRLPFASPDDPLLKARLAGLEREGRNGFNEYQVPQAVLALKQGVGRLIRDPADFGVVMLADPRLLTRGYGRAFLRSLPPMTVTRDGAAAAAFLAAHVAGLAGAVPA